MSIDGFLTVLALAAAIFAVVPPVPRLRVRLGVWIQAPLAVATLLLVIYLELYGVFGQPCPARLGAVCQALTFQPDEKGGFVGLSPPQLAFLVVLGWMGVAWCLFLTARPGLGALPPMARLVDLLLVERRYAEVADFIRPYLKFLGRVSNQELPSQRLGARLGDWRGADAEWLRLLEPDRDKRPQHPLVQSLRRAVGELGRVVPHPWRAVDAASQILRSLFHSHGLRRFTAELRPYFALELMGLKGHERFKFFDAYMLMLIERPGSALYEELEQNQNLSSLHRYALPESNRLLRFLFADAKVASEFGAWQSVGDHALRLTQAGEDDATLARLNRPSGDFDKLRWGDPVATALHYFDVMVSSAAFQSVPDHMWLFYVPKLVKNLAQTYDPSGESVDETDEFPTQGARLIYEAFNMMGDWVGFADSLPETSVHRNIPPWPSRESVSIPMNAAIALGEALRSVVLAGHISQSFRRYMVEVALRDLKALPVQGENARMRPYLLATLLHGGSRGEFDRDYLVELLALYEGLDPGLRYDVPDFAAAFEQALNS